MDVEMKMPDLATISASVKVLRWLAEPGQGLRRGDPLLEVETDKATLVIESALTGTLRAVLARPGEEVPGGEPIARFEVDAEDETALPPAAPSAPARGPEPTPPPASAPPTPAPPRGTGSFFARNRRAAADEPGPES